MNMASIPVQQVSTSCIIPIALPHFFHISSLQEKGVEKSRHFRAAVHFVTAVGYVDVLLLAPWPHWELGHTLDG